MIARLKKSSHSSWISASQLLGSLVLVVAVLYWAREVFIPVALAILLTFIFAPVVNQLKRRGFGRTIAVTLTVTLAMVVIAGIGAMIFVELRSLANDLPSYRQNILKKIYDLRVATKSSSLERVQNTIKEVVDEFKRDDAPSEQPQPQPRPAVPVTVTNEQSKERSGIAVVGQLLEPIGSAGLVVVLVIFMLLRREDLRDRLLGLAGYSGLAATTKAVDDAGKRVSRYLLCQFAMNAGFGVAVGVGLAIIGLPYPMLWGVLAGVARFIPYLGPWLGALAPILVSLAVFDSWTTPLIVIALVGGLELVNNMIVEPLLYGQSMGVSEVALIIMMAFWTWLWGPVGLVLAAPLTVCLMVISKSVPDLEFLGTLLSSDPAMAPHQVLYQRLVAKDQDEAQDVVEEFLKEHSREELFEQLLIPTLVASRHDYSRSRLEDEDLSFAFQFIRELVEDPEAALDNVPSRPGDSPNQQESTPCPLMIGYPANDEADELALLMLAEMLREKNHRVRILSHEHLCNEAVEIIAQTNPPVVCIGTLLERQSFPVRQFCKRLAVRCPKLPILLGRWGANDHEKIKERFSGMVSEIGFSLTESASQILQFSQIDQGNAPCEDARKGDAKSHEQPLVTP